MNRWRRSLSALGPGVLFAGTAVGVSHLGQSTRAGAAYGFGLVGLLVLAHLAKYPAFRFGPLYTTATGHSLLEGYRQQGTWALVLYGVLTVGTMFIVQGAIAAFTAALLLAATGSTLPLPAVAAALLMFCALLVGFGGYRALDRVSKLVVGVLVLSTLLATVLALPKLTLDDVQILPPLDLSAPLLAAPRDLAFMVAFVGWMPSAIDVSVWQSLWTLDSGRDKGGAVAEADSSFDFHVGYFGTALLAFCFLLLGDAVFHGSGTALASRPAAFAAQVISVYGETLGGWSLPLIGAAAFLTMFSTMLTVTDGFPRALTVLGRRFRSAENSDPNLVKPPDRTLAYWAWLVVLVIGGYLVITFLGRSLPALVDAATTMSFTTAPILSYLNHRAVTSGEVVPARGPSPGLVRASWLAIGFQVIFAGVFLLSKVE